MNPSMAAASTVARDEELRIALVMNGGVSLAVWIGGVTFEINRFVGETHPVYRQLLELTLTRARVDVISGTSAGGVNGAAMALATVYDKSLYALREIWLNRGALADLLRKASEKDPPSLLDGDGYYLPLLRRAFADLTRRVPRPPASAPLVLSMPTTLLRGEPNARLDDLGETLEDTSHRGQFRFARDATSDPFVHPAATAAAMAQAARASSSFPVAFEPVLTDAEQLFVGSGRRKTKFAHFVVDGGVLDNKPIEGALRAIVQMPAQGNVRRVLAYVVPDPGVSSLAKSDAADAPPELAEVALSSLVSIPGAESISDQLDAIDEHNARVRHLRNLPAVLVTTLGREPLQDLAHSLFPAYRKRRISGVLDYVLEEIDQSASAPATGRTPGAYGRHTRNWLKALWLGMPAQQAAGLFRDFIPEAERAFDFTLEVRDADRPFTWGLFSLEYLTGVVLDLVRRTQRLLHLAEARDTSVRAPLPLPAAPAAEAEAPAHEDWEALDQALRDRRASAKDEPMADWTIVRRDALADIWQATFALRDRLAMARAGGSERLRDQAPELLRALAPASGAAAAAGRVEPEQAARDWLLQHLQATRIDGATSAQARVENRFDWARELAAILLALRPHLERITARAPATVQSLRPEELTAWRELNAFHRYLFDGPGAGADVVMQRLLAFEVVQYASAERPRDADTLVELVQISARQQSPLGGGATPDEKLAGMQLAHFGAFYRKAWRANDWMMGRLDGISRIVRVALNPDRLHRLYGGGTVDCPNAGRVPSAQYVAGMLHAIACGEAAPAVRDQIERAWLELEPQIGQELAFLAAPGARVPEMLPACCELLTRRLHLEVLCREIAQLATAVRDDIDAGAAKSTPGGRLAGQVAYAAAANGLMARVAGSPWVARATQAPWLGNALQSVQQLMGAPTIVDPTVAPDVAVRLFREYRVGTEKLAGELGTDLMLRTGSQTAAVAHAAASGKRSGLKPATPVLNAARWPVRMLYLLGNRLSEESRTSAGITTALLVAGLLLAYASLVWKDAPAAAAPVGWSLLFAWFITAFLRNRLAAVGIALCVAAVLFFGTDAEKAARAAAAVAAVLAITFLPAWLGLGLVALGVAWWLTDAPAWADILGALCQRFDIQRCVDLGAPGNAQSFIKALLLLSLVFLAAVLARVADRRSK